MAGSDVQKREPGLCVFTVGGATIILEEPKFTHLLRSKFYCESTGGSQTL